MSIEVKAFDSEIIKHISVLKGTEIMENILKRKKVAGSYFIAIDNLSHTLNFSMSISNCFIGEKLKGYKPSIKFKEDNPWKKEIGFHHYTDAPIPLKACYEILARESVKLLEELSYIAN